MRAGGLSPATRAGGSVNSCRGKAFNEGRGFIPGNARATPRLARGWRPFNEGRGFIPGNATRSLLSTISVVSVQ